MLVKINLEDVLEFVEDGKDCKVEIDQDGRAYVIPQDAAGYDDSILIQYFDSEDYQECENEEEYISWLKDNFESADLEANNGEFIKVEFEK